jgi:hypothetical protein
VVSYRYFANCITLRLINKHLFGALDPYVEMQGTGTRGIYKIVDLSDMYNTN